MTISRDASSENDVLYEFSLGYEHPDPERLDEFARAHPTYADALTTLAIELAIERVVEGESASEAQFDSKDEALLSKAMSQLQNRLYDIRAAQTPAHAAPARTKPRDLFGSLSREHMRDLAIKLQATPLFLRRLRNCEIRVDTMTPGFMLEVAKVMGEPQVEVAHYFAKSSSQLSVHDSYKSEVTPTAGAQVTFEEAVRDSGLSSEQQARLLKL